MILITGVIGWKFQHFTKPYFSLAYLYLNRAWLCDNCKVEQLAMKHNNVYTKLKYVLTTAWYRNNMYLFLHVCIQRGAGGPDPIPG